MGAGPGPAVRHADRAVRAPDRHPPRHPPGPGGLADPGRQLRMRSGVPVDLPWLDEPRFQGFGCSPRNDRGLALRMYRVEENRLGTDVTFPDRYESYPGVVHGGIVSALVDEL